MTRQEREKYRERLVALGEMICGDRAQLKEEAMQTAGGEASGGLSDFPLHMADLSAHLSEGVTTLTMLENEEALIEEINRALARIEDGTFGRCEACHRRIARRRLHALPYARHCIACARKEAGEPDHVGTRLRR
jgi:RNA polymerase-binding transcription factor DksA